MAISAEGKALLALAAIGSLPFLKKSVRSQVKMLWHRFSTVRKITSAIDWLERLPKFIDNVMALQKKRGLSLSGASLFLVGQLDMHLPV